MPPQPTTVAELGRLLDVDLSAVGGLMQETSAQNAPAHLFSGTAAPASGLGANGDYYFRVDGGSSTHIYFKSSGSWAGII